MSLYTLAGRSIPRSGGSIFSDRDTGAGRHALPPAHRRRGPLAAFLYFAGTLFPVLGFLHIFPFRDSYVADHFQYLASLGIIIPAASLAADAADGLQLGKLTQRFLTAALAVLLGVLTWRHSGAFRDDESLYRASLAVNPDSWIAQNNLGIDLLKPPVRIPEAITHFREALRLRPDYKETYVNLGNQLLSTKGGEAEALRLFEAALRIDPRYAAAHTGLGAALAAYPDRRAESEAHFRQAIRFQPLSVDAYSNLAKLLAMAPSRAEDVITVYRHSLAAVPGRAQGHADLGTALFAVPEHRVEAALEFQEAIRLSPDLAAAHLGLCATWFSLPDRWPDAIPECREAIRLRGDYLEARLMLANALGQLGRIGDSVREYEEVLRLDPNQMQAHYALGRFLAAAPGRSPDAIAHLTFVLHARPDLEPARKLLEKLQAGPR